MASSNHLQSSSPNSRGSGGGSDQRSPAQFDESRWVIQIRHSLEEEHDEDAEGTPVSVFNVPKLLMVAKTEAFVPQLIALGPYHHWRPELYEMERYKLAAARRTQKHFLSATVKLQHLVDQFTKLEHKIRAHYHRYLDFSGETVAWMMAVDASFLLEFLHIYAVQEEGKVLRRLSSRMSHLVDCTGRKSAHNVILRDIMMLENQIPLFLIRKIMELQSPSTEAADAALNKMVAGLLKELSPFKLMENFPCGDAGGGVDVSQHSHLLELLYYVVVPRFDDQGDQENNEIEEQNDDGLGDPTTTKKEGGTGAGDSSYVRQLFRSVWSVGSTLNGAPVRFVRGIILSRPVKFLVQVPWKILTSLPGFSVLKQPIEYVFSFDDAGGQLSGSKTDAAGSGGGISRPPLVEEIMIPSVSDLVDSGVKIAPTSGDLTTIAFDARTVTLYLPAVTLDVNTEVVLRNLVAYEASAARGPLVFTRYTELMNGIVDTEEDVRLLRERGVVLNRMKSDAQVAKLWNGMSRSVRLTRVGFMDKVIEEVNRYHESRWRVKTGRFMRRYVFGSWQFLTFVAAVLLLLLTGLQAFCSVYTCSRWFGGVVNAQRLQ